MHLLLLNMHSYPKYMVAPKMEGHVRPTTLNCKIRSRKVGGIWPSPMSAFQLVVPQQTTHSYSYHDVF